MKLLVVVDGVKQPFLYMVGLLGPFYYNPGDYFEKPGNKIKYDFVVVVLEGSDRPLVN